MGMTEGEMDSRFLGNDRRGVRMKKKINKFIKKGRWK